MKTDELISLLATGIEPVDRWLFARRLVIGLLIALLGASLMTVMLFGVRSDLAQVAATPLFWGKLALPGALLIGAL
ncbi:MAG: NrsF family protein, partial [Pseudomonas sp.]